MTSEDLTLDERYLEWLYKSVAVLKNRNPARSYWNLCVALFSTEFEWFIPNDDNRIMDGKDLREEFLDISGYKGDKDWLEQGCSMLEMLVALSRRIAFEANHGDAFEWFWIMIDNVGLRPFVDADFNDDFNTDVGVILERVIQRTYDPDGSGGLFPLSATREDQRQVEIWYQLAAYLLENHEAG